MWLSILMISWYNQKQQLGSFLVLKDIYFDNFTKKPIKTMQKFYQLIRKAFPSHTGMWKMKAENTNRYELLTLNFARPG